MTAPLVDPGELALLATELAVEAGALLAEGQRGARTSVATKSSLTDMVTEMDQASEALISRRLLERRPDDGLVGEEGAERPGTSGVEWVVDPLDGTTNYLYGYGAYAVSIAARVDGETVAGVVRDPVHDETFVAVRGAGATLDGRTLHLAGAATLSTALVGTGFSYVSSRRADQAAVLVRVLPAVRDLRRGGAAALDLCWVGVGRLDAFFEVGLQPWDWAAGALVAAEAGARTEVRAGGLHIAAPPHLFDGLTALVE